MAATHTQIRGDDYVLTPNEWGYQITANTKATDRFYRTYQVTVTDATVTKCSCPDHAYRNRICKHMTAVADEKKLTLTSL